MNLNLKTTETNTIKCEIKYSELQRNDYGSTRDETVILASLIQCEILILYVK